MKSWLTDETYWSQSRRMSYITSRNIASNFTVVTPWYTSFTAFSRESAVEETAMTRPPEVTSFPSSRKVVPAWKRLSCLARSDFFVSYRDRVSEFSGCSTCLAMTVVHFDLVYSRILSRVPTSCDDHHSAFIVVHFHFYFLHFSFNKSFHDLCEVGFDQRKLGLRFWITETCVVFEHLRSWLCEHDACEEHPDEWNSCRIRISVTIIIKNRSSSVWKIILPSCRKPLKVGSRMSLSISCSTAVFGPLSPSKILLWSWAVA